MIAEFIGGPKNGDEMQIDSYKYPQAIKAIKPIDVTSWFDPAASICATMDEVVYVPVARITDWNDNIVRVLYWSGSW